MNTTYGGLAYGIPRKRLTGPESIPKKEPSSKVAIGPVDRDSYATTESKLNGPMKSTVSSTESIPSEIELQE